MSEPEGDSVLAVTAANYLLRLTAVPGPMTGFAQIVPADPRRWFLQIDVVGGGGGQSVYPAPGVAGQTTYPTLKPPLIYKFRDAPALTQAAWFGSSGVGTIYFVWEELYIRG